MSVVAGVALGYIIGYIALSYLVPSIAFFLIMLLIYKVSGNYFGLSVSRCFYIGFVFWPKALIWVFTKGIKESVNEKMKSDLKKKGVNVNG